MSNNKGVILIEVELLREMLDLPDGLTIESFGQAPLEGLSKPRGLVVVVSGEGIAYTPNGVHTELTPRFTREEVGEVIRVRLDGIGGFAGNLSPRPSERRQIRATAESAAQMGSRSVLPKGSRI